MKIMYDENNHLNCEKMREKEGVKYCFCPCQTLFLNMGHVATKPVFRVSDKARLKPVSLASETS